MSLRLCCILTKQACKNQIKLQEKIKELLELILSMNSKKEIYNGTLNNLLTEHISKILKNGVKIFELHYKFLGYSNS